MVAARGVYPSAVAARSAPSLQTRDPVYETVVQLVVRAGARRGRFTKDTNLERLDPLLELLELLLSRSDHSLQSEFSFC